MFQLKLCDHWRRYRARGARVFRDIRRLDGRPKIVIFAVVFPFFPLQTFFRDGPQVVGTANVFDIPSLSIYY